MEKKKKLIFLITKSNWGGAQTYVYDLATSKLRDEFEISVALGGNGALAERLSESNLKIHRLERLARNINLFDEITVLWQLIKLFIQERPDIVHVNSSKIGGLGAFAARCTLVKRVVFTAHGWPFNEERSWPQRTAIKFFSWLTVFFSTDTIVIGRTELEQSSAWPLVHNKLHLIPISVKNFETKSREDSMNQIAEIIKVPVHEINKKVIIGTIAELHRNKGLNYLIRGFKTASIPDSILIIISPGEEKIQLEKIIREEGLENTVFLLGFVKDARKLLKAFDVFILTSLKEGLPYTILEAGLAKVPVIATNVGAISEVIIDTETGLLIEPKDITAVSEAIQKLVSNPSLRNKVKENLSKKVMAEYNLDKMIESTKAVYSES